MYKLKSMTMIVETGEWLATQVESGDTEEEERGKKEEKIDSVVE